MHFEPPAPALGDSAFLSTTPGRRTLRRRRFQGKDTAVPPGRAEACRGGGQRERLPLLPSSHVSRLPAGHPSNPRPPPAPHALTRTSARAAGAKRATLALRPRRARTHRRALREVVTAQRVIQIEAHHLAVGQGKVLLHGRAATAGGGRRRRRKRRRKAHGRCFLRCGAVRPQPLRPAPTPPRRSAAALTCAEPGHQQQS